MEDRHKYHVLAWWTAGRTGIAKSDSATNAILFTAPPEFHGLKGRWTPEDLLLCALASCFTTTFHAIAGYAKFEYTDLEAEVERVISKADSGYLQRNRSSPKPDHTVRKGTETCCGAAREGQDFVSSLPRSRDCPEVQAQSGSQRRLAGSADCG